MEVGTMTGELQPNSSEYEAERRRHMVKTQLGSRDIKDQRVLEAMSKVPRHLFTPKQYRDNAYADRPLPIGHDQTISQPYIVALMTQLTRPQPHFRALDVGTGSGYQAAVLAELCQQVYSIEIIQPLADSARDRLRELGYGNVEVRCGDAYHGWPEHGPFELIIAAAAPGHIPDPLVEQLAIGGRLVLPLGAHGIQELIIVEKQEDGSVRQWSSGGVAFVPMTGEVMQDRKRGWRK